MNRNNMFYTETELGYAVSKREMDNAEVGHIKSGDDTIDCKVGNTWKRYTVEEFLDLAFTDGKSLEATTEDGGLLIRNK